MTVGTRERMILAAERLFGERGIGGVSLREVGVAAGQRNNSAAQYHFGTKEGLVHAVLDFRMDRVDERRVALLAEFDATGRPHDLRALVEAYVIPLAEVGREGEVSWHARFLAQLLTRTDLVIRSMGHRRADRGLVVVLAGLSQRLAGLPPVLRDQRLLLAATLTINALADQALGGEEQPLPGADRHGGGATSAACGCRRRCGWTRR